MFWFTIRELVLLTLVVAMGVAWFMDRRSLANKVDRLAEYELAEQQEKEWQAAQETNQDKLFKYLRERTMSTSLRQISEAVD